MTLVCGGAADVLVVPPQYVADDRRLLQSEALSFGAVNEIDLEADVHGFTLLLATMRRRLAGQMFQVARCVVSLSGPFYRSV